MAGALTTSNQSNGAWRDFRFVMIMVLVAVAGVVAVTRPMIVPIALFAALFYFPLYGPFLLSFLIRKPQWGGLRWALRFGSLAALLVRAVGMSGRPNFGQDVAGDLAGAAHNFAWTWGAGVGCTMAALIVGILLRRSSQAKEQGHAKTGF